MNKYDIIIFDLDGTLLNTLEDITDSVNYAMADLDFPAVTIGDVRNFVGNGAARLIELCIPEGKHNPRFNEALCLYKNHYSSNYQNKTQPYPGIIELLTELNARDFKLAVISNKSDSYVKNLCEYYFKGYFQATVGERDGMKIKPSPDAVFHILEILGGDKAKAVYVGDSDVDVETARNAGVKGVMVSWGFRDKDALYKHGAEIVVDEPAEILNYI